MVSCIFAISLLSPGGKETFLFFVLLLLLFLLSFDCTGERWKHPLLPSNIFRVPTDSQRDNFFSSIAGFMKHGCGDALVVLSCVPAGNESNKWVCPWGLSLGDARDA